MKRRIRWALAILVAAIVFVVGIAVGEAIHDNPKPGITLTTTRTIHP
jgi:hypothetical protein